MDSEHDKKKMNVEGDRISSLPDDLIHKILSYIGIEQAIETSALSTRWRFIWTTMPCLSFSSDASRTSLRASRFITQYFSRRNNQTEVTSMKLICESFKEVVVKKFLNYASSNNIQQLTLKCYTLNTDDFPLYVFSSQSLKHLTLCGTYDSKLYVSASTWDLVALTSLHLEHVSFFSDNTDKECIGFFPKSVNLKNLTLYQCVMEQSGSLRICHPCLFSLTIRNFRGKLFQGDYPLQFSTDSLRSLEKVDLCIDSPREADASKIFGLLQKLHNVKFLTLNTELVEFLSSFMERIFSPQASPFANLQSLKIYPKDIFVEGEENISTEMKYYLLKSSPSAVFTMISREVSRAEWNTTQAQRHMALLRVRLENEKATFETNLDKGKAQVEIEEEGERQKQINSCWKDMIVRTMQGREKTSDIILQLEYIERLLTELPASKRAKIQPSFSSLRAETDNVINKIMGCMKIQCDEKQSLLNGYFFEFTSQTSS